MEHGHVPHRGSQRALKMLNAQLQKTSSSQPAPKPAAARLSWPTTRPAPVISLDPPPEAVTVANSSRHSQLTNRATQQHHANTVTTPIASQWEVHVYASPEANFPSNGGVIFENRDRNNVSRDGFESSGGALVYDFNNNSNFSAPATQPTQPLVTETRSSSATSMMGHAFTANRQPEQDHAFAVETSEDEMRSNMCFSLCDGKVTSIVATPDGAYCIAGFSTGAVRLYDMTIDGNTDPEDRFGYQIGMIESSRGSVQVHLELGTAVAGTANCTVDCCHLFANARQGSTSMLVVDIGFLREVHRKRGFISMAGGGVQTLTHSDGRLKGLTALSTVSSHRPNTGPDASAGDALQVNAVSATSVGVNRGYAVTYRLITGRGFGNYHVWEVALEARLAGLSVGSPMAGSSGASGGSSGGLVYKQSWRHLYQGPVNGPTMTFATFVESSSALPVQAAEGGQGASGRLSLWEQCQQRARLDQGQAVSNGPSIELVASDKQKDLRMVSLSDLPSDGSSSTGALTASKPATLKDTTGTYASSQDGRILFGGQYELAVSVLETSRRSSSSTGGSGSDADDMVGTTRISYRAVFSLSDFAPGAVGKSSKKASRHLREVSDVWCTPDGAYALILCTDNAVLLYSACDVTSHGSFPTRTEGVTSLYRVTGGATGGSGGGYLTFLFQADDAFNLDLGIAYACGGAGHEDAGGSAVVSGHSGVSSCLCGVHAERIAVLAQQHRRPENVLLCFSWWLIENPSQAGALKVCRLKLPSARSSSALVRPHGAFEHIVPSTIAVSALVSDPRAATTGGRAGASGRCCALCGDTTAVHWPEDALSAEEMSLVMATEAGKASSSAGAAPARADHGSKVADKRPPPGKRRETRRDSDSVASSVPPRPAPKEKRQKVAHPPKEAERRHSGSDAGDAHHGHLTSEDDYFTYDSDTQLTREASRTEPPDCWDATKGDQCQDKERDRDSICSRDDGDAGETGDMDDSSQLELSQPAVVQDDDASLPPRKPTSRAGRERATGSSADAGSGSVPGTSGGGGGNWSQAVQQLRQELERVRMENKRLRDDTDLTMRKADRRFELEMEARRYWKREKTELEGVISGLRKDQQRWVEEREKLRRLHGVLQTVFYASSGALDSCLEGLPGSGESSTVLTQQGSPATRLRTDLSAVGNGEATTSLVSHSSSNIGGSSSSSNGTGVKRVQFFCIVCLEHTARVAIEPCGHICFCVVHAEEMLLRQHDHHYTKCPLCQTKIGGFLTLQGVDA